MPQETKDPNALHMASEAGFAHDFDALIEKAERAEPEAAQPVSRLNWRQLAGETPPAREWAIDHWFGMGHVTLLAGAGGLGKTSIAQAMASCLAMHRDYLDNVSKPRRVLMWACEDDAEELWRRQIKIAESLGIPLADFDKNFILMPYDGEDVELCAARDGAITASPMLEQLRQQIGDYKADAVILDNIARLYGCSENDRHQVTSFIAMLTKAARPTGAGLMLLGHPAKATGSEYSGSTAWEGAVRSRLYLGRVLPDQEQTVEPKEDDGIRYLCRRKANYSTRDYRRIRYVNGVMIPDDADRPVTSRPTEYAQDAVIRAIASLERIGKYGNSSTASPDYLPKLADQYKLIEGIGRKQFASAVRELEVAGKIKLETIGHYQNRSPKKGFKVVV
jgi:RecA-family ATPase